jgi:hypothetical protein
MRLLQLAASVAACLLILVGPAHSVSLKTLKALQEAEQQKKAKPLKKKPVDPLARNPDGTVKTVPTRLIKEGEPSAPPPRGVCVEGWNRKTGFCN